MKLLILYKMQFVVLDVTDKSGQWTLMEELWIQCHFVLYVLYYL